MRSFVAVAQEEHLTRAAERLHLSQPSISGHIKALEQEVGLPLFIRTPKGMSLTREGEVILAQALEVLKANQSLLARARALHTTRFVKMTIGVLAEDHFPELGDFIVQLKKHCPNIELHLEQHLSGTTLKYIESGRLDCGFILGAAHTPGMHATPVKKIRFRIVGPPAWAAQLDQADWNDIATLPWIFTPTECGISRVAMDSLRARGIEPRVTVTADSHTAISALLAAEIGIALMSEHAIETAASMEKIALWKQGSIETMAYFVHLRDRTADPLITLASGIIEELWSSKLEGGNTQADV